MFPGRTGWFHSAPFWRVALEQQPIKQKAGATLYWVYIICIVESSLLLPLPLWGSFGIMPVLQMRFSDLNKVMHPIYTRSQETDPGHLLLGYA